MTRMLPVCLLLVSCYSVREESRPVNAAEQDVVDQLIADWSGKKISALNHVCFERVNRWRVAYTDGERFDNLCRKSPGVHTSSCFLDDASGFVFTADIYPTAVIRSSFDDAKKMRALKHEALHWLSWCGGFGLDYQHENAKVWALEK